MIKSSSMYHWRITKYNPKYRNEKGAYLRDEWTCFSEVGKSFNGKMVTLAGYLAIEDAYINAILEFMNCLHVSELKVTSLNKVKRPFENEIYNQELIDLFDKIKNRHLISGPNVEIITRLVLRNNLWCRLKSDDMYVHFGWDYYMYMGSKKECKNTIARIDKSGLFVEVFKSPYLPR